MTGSAVGSNIYIYLFIYDMKNIDTCCDFLVHRRSKAVCVKLNMGEAMMIDRFNLLATQQPQGPSNVLERLKLPGVS